MQDTWCVYRHISPSNKVYIGITSRKPELRWGHNGIYYIDGEFIQRYESVTEASNVVGVSTKAIRNCCNGGYYCRNKDTYINVRQSGGFIWKWCNKEKGVGI